MVKTVPISFKSPFLSENARDIMGCTISICKYIDNVERIRETIFKSTNIKTG